MDKISKENEILIKAKVLDHLVEHLRKRSDVQNIDLMNLSGFCRNCFEIYKFIVFLCYCLFCISSISTFIFLYLSD